MANIVPGNTYLVIPAADFEQLIALNYTDVANDFCLTHPTDSTYRYAQIGDVSEAELQILFLFYYGDEDFDGNAPIFDYMVSDQVPGPGSLWNL